MDTKSTKGRLLYPSSPAAKLMEVLAAPMGWGLWALVVSEGEIESIAFIVPFLVGLSIYKCPLEIAAMLSKLAPSALFIAVVFGVPGAIMFLLGDSLPEDSVGVLAVGGIGMAGGLQMRMKKALKNKNDHQRTNPH